MTDEERDAQLNVVIKKIVEKNFESAIADLDSLINRFPEYGNVWFYRGLCFQELENFELAIKNYDYAIQFLQDIPSAWLNRGLCKLNLGQYNEAILDYDQVMQSYQGESGFWHNRGFANHRLKKFEEAAKDFDKAIQLDKTNAGAYYSSAYSKARLGLQEAAKVDFAKAIELRPNDIDTHWELGLLETDSSLRSSKCLKNLHLVFSDIVDEYTKQHANFLTKSFYIFMPIDADRLSGLANNYLWLSDPNNFNDPLDGQPLRLHIAKEFETYPEVQHLLNSVRIRALAEGSDVKTIAEDSKLLWSHYANSHRGMMIEIKFTSTFFTEKKIGLRKVAYGKDLSDLGVDGIKDIINEFCFTKTKEWAYENEYRLIALADDLKDKNKLDKKYFTLESICFGFKTPPDHKSLVYTILSQNYFDKLDYYEVEQPPDDKRKDPFTLICTKIDKPGKKYRDN